jgi:hypothetical protein
MTGAEAMSEDIDNGLDDGADDGPLDPFILPFGPDDLVLQSEFGGVVLSKDVSANGERLRVLGITSGVEIFLDPLELERIAVAGHDAARQERHQGRRTLQP